MPGGDITRKLLTGWLSRLKRRSFRPRFFIRICRQPTDLAIIVNLATAEDIPPDQELIDRVVENLLDEGKQELSVYGSKTDEPFDVGHALAVVAAKIASDSFSKERSRRSNSTKCGSLCVPIDALPSSVSYKHTPHNNANFSPADDRHYDLMVEDPKGLAKAILSGLKSGVIGSTFLEKQDQTFRFQMIIAFSHCTYMFGKLQEKSPPTDWKDGRTLTAAEQIETLRHLSRVDELYRPKKP